MQSDNVLAYSYEDAAKQLGVSKQTVIRLVKDGKLPAKSIGRRVVIPKEALERLLS